MVKERMDLLELLRKGGMDGDVDFLREALRVLVEGIMDAEVSSRIGAEYGERSPERVTQRNGYRSRAWDTRVGTMDLHIPKLREGSYFPSLLESRRRSERALLAVIQQAYVEGVSTRRVDDLVKALGCEGISKSQVSRICQELDVVTDNHLEQAWQIGGRLTSSIENVIVGKGDVVQMVVALFSRGHVLIEGVPGVGKTMLARAIARSIGGTFRRIQCTADLLPSDITGVYVFDQGTREFNFRPGPVMANVVLVDEINRASPKTQSAPPGVHGRAPDNYRGRNPCHAGPVSTAGHPEPHGARRHLPATRDRAGQVSAASPSRLSYP